jgi:hypothetical protein
MKARIINTPKPPSCQGYEASTRNLKLWAKVKGLTVKIGPSVEPNSAWQCGTDEVFPIVDADYYKRIKAIDYQGRLFICKHAIAEFVNDVTPAGETK